VDLIARCHRKPAAPVGGGLGRLDHLHHRFCHGIIRVRMIGQGGADRGAGGGENDRHRGNKHAVGTRNRVVGFLGHWGALVSALGRLVNKAWSISRLRILRPFSAFLLAVAISIRLCRLRVFLTKFRIVPSPGMGAYPLPLPNRQTKFFSNVTERHSESRKTQRFPGVTAEILNITTAFFQCRLRRRQPGDRHAEG